MQLGLLGHHAHPDLCQMFHHEQKMQKDFGFGFHQVFLSRTALNWLGMLLTL